MEGRLGATGGGPQLREVAVEGERVRCLEQGSGPAVLLVHGFASSAGLSFGRLFAELPDGYHFIAIDLAGLGWSDRRRGRRWDPGAQAERLLRVLDELEIERTAVVGTSLGGAVAQHMALLAPERVERLVLLSSLDASRQPPYRVWLLAPVIAAALAAAKAPRMGPRVRTRIARPPAGFDDWWTERRALEATAFVLMPRTVRSALRVIFDSMLGPRAAIWEIAAPTLVVSGGRDTTIPPPVGARIASRIPAARHVVLPGCGHCLAIEQPREVAGLVESALGGSAAPAPIGERPQPGRAPKAAQLRQALGFARQLRRG